MALKLPSLPEWKYFSFSRSDTMPVGSSIPARINVNAKMEQYDSSEDCKPSALLAFIENCYRTRSVARFIISLYNLLLSL